MLSVLPVYGEFDLPGIIVHGHDDILDQRAQQPLLKTHVDVGSVPRGPELLSQAGKIRRGSIIIANFSVVKPGFAGFDTAQRRLLALLKLSSYEPVVGIAGSIASFGERGFVARLPQIQFDHLPSLRFAFKMHALGLQCCFDRQGRHGTQSLLRDGGVGSTAIGGHASGPRQRLSGN